MGIGNLLRKEQAVARDGIGGIIVGFRKHARYAKAGERREREREFIWLQIASGDVPAKEEGCYDARTVRTFAETCRTRMFPSTHSRSVRLPVYGDPGVDSSMNRPYSGW